MYPTPLWHLAIWFWWFKLWLSRAHIAVFLYFRFSNIRWWHVKEIKAMCRNVWRPARSFTKLYFLKLCRILGHNFLHLWISEVKYMIPHICRNSVWIFWEKTLLFWGIFTVYLLRKPFKEISMPYAVMFPTSHRHWLSVTQS